MGKRSTRRRGSTPLFETKHGVAHCRKFKLCAECGAKLRGRRTRWCSDQCVTAYLIRADPQVARRNVHARDKGVCAFCDLDTDALRERVKAADRTAFKEFLDDENRRRPEGYMRDVSKPDKWAHMGYARNHGPWTHAGHSPGASWSNSATGRTGLRELVKRHRLALFKGTGFETHWWRKTFWDMDHVLEVSRGGGECGLNNLRTLCVVCHVKRSARRTTQLAKKRRAKRVPRKPREACKAPPGECAGPDPCRPCRRYRARVLGYAVPHG